ncbi:MAG: hypothetical protein R3B96_17035 [Pirellulaceae bacterium]
MNNAVTSDRSVRRWMLVIGLLEVAALLVLFAWYGGTPPPDVNEAHYLAKAKHFWQPDWCSGDLFLGEAHWAFYVIRLARRLGRPFLHGLDWSYLSLARTRGRLGLFIAGSRLAGEPRF